MAVCYLGQHEHEPLQSSVHLQSGPQLQLAKGEEGGGGGSGRGKKEKIKLLLYCTIDF